jgi:hypothetical protein
MSRSIPRAPARRLIPRALLSRLIPRALLSRSIPRALLSRCILCTLVLAGACKRASEDRAAGDAPFGRPPISGSPEVPAALQIAVEVDGREAQPIDAARLRALKADFEEPGRRAWRLAALLGIPLAEGATVEVERADGVKVSLPVKSADGREAAIELDRRGEVLFAVLRADDPFPAFHGRGGNRGRPGDPLTRVRDLKRLRVVEPAPRR